MRDAFACSRALVSASDAMRNSSPSTSYGSDVAPRSCSVTRIPVSDVSRRASAASAVASGRPASGSARKLSTDARACAIDARATSSAVAMRLRRRRLARQVAQRALELQRDRGEVLRERVVDLAREPRALRRARGARLFFRQPPALDREADLRAGDREQPQVAFGQPARHAAGRRS